MRLTAPLMFPDPPMKSTRMRFLPLVTAARAYVARGVLVANHTVMSSSGGNGFIVLT
jgi:hypothetical protein